MGEVEIVGMVAVGLASVFGLFSMFINLIIKPVNELTISVTTLVAALDAVNINHGEMKATIKEINTRLDVVERKLDRVPVTS